MKAKRTNAKAGSLKRRENRAIAALIALALRPPSKPPTDAEIEQFLRECRAGKHKLNAESKAALDRAGKKLILELKQHMGKTGNTIYGKPVNPQTEP